MHPSAEIIKLPPRGPDHDLTLVIPAYNEEKRLPRTLSQVQEYLDRWGINYRVIVVDDGSRDGTAAVAEGFRSAVSRHFVADKSRQRGRRSLGHARAPRAAWPPLPTPICPMRSKACGPATN